MAPVRLHHAGGTRTGVDYDRHEKGGWRGRGVRRRGGLEKEKDSTRERDASVCFRGLFFWRCSSKNLFCVQQS